MDQLLFYVYFNQPITPFIYSKIHSEVNNSEILPTMNQMKEKPLLGDKNLKYRDYYCVTLFLFKYLIYFYLVDLSLFFYKNLR